MPKKIGLKNCAKNCSETGIASETILGFSILMKPLQLTTNIRIYVPFQESAWILLSVRGDTTLKEIHSELRSWINQPSGGSTWIRAYTEIENSGSSPIYFMRECTVAQALQEGVQCFEIFFTDLLV